MSPMDRVELMRQLRGGERIADLARRFGVDTAAVLAVVDHAIGAQVCRRHADGEDSADIAVAFGCGITTIRWLLERGAERQALRQKRSKAARAVQLWRQGLRRQAIEQRLAISGNRLLAMLQEAGVVASARKQALTEAERRLIVVGYLDEGLSMDTLAARWSCATKTIRGVLEEAGVALRTSGQQRALNWQAARRRKQAAFRRVETQHAA